MAISGEPLALFAYNEANGFLIVEAHMFEGLDDINWGEIDHIHGSAAEVPLWIRDLAHNSDALFGIFDYGQTSGSIYESTGYIVPFVIDLLLVESVPDKPRIVEELSNVCWVFPVSYNSIREARNGLKIHDAFISKLSVLRDLARTGEGNVRVGIIDILSRFREFSSQLMPEFKALFESERSEAVQIALIEALSELVFYTTLPQQHEFLRWFNQIVEDQEYSMAIRVEVAFAVLSLGTKWKWSTLEAEMSLIAVEVLASVLNDISEDNTVTLFPKYERAAKALAKLNLDSIIAVFKSEYLGAQGTHFLVREALDQVFYRICHDKDWMFYDGSFAGHQRSFWYEIKELGMWIRRDYIPNHTLSAQFGESPQRRLLAVIVDIDCFWEIPTNLFSFFYGLPDTREELRALLAKASH